VTSCPACRGDIDRGDPPSRDLADLDGVVIGPACFDRLLGISGGGSEVDAADEFVVHAGPASADDERWYPAGRLPELIEQYLGPADPDAAP
jgi:hypothetical protein